MHCLVYLTYDSNGMRTSRTNGTATYSYVYNGSKLMQMTVGTNTLTFTYDGSGNPSTVTLNGTTYYYITNLQGDVIEIRMASGSKACSYSYDAWGNVISYNCHTNSSIYLLNPLLYRGYVYDHDTGFYYLQSRYYDPKVCRFLNADIVFDYDAGVQGYNLFVYCGNDPLNRIDVSGADSNKMDDGELTDDEMDSWGSGGGGPLWGVGTSSTSSGFAYAYNPMDAGYAYHIDLTVASNSSLYYGGLTSSGVTMYYTTAVPTPTSPSQSSKRHTPDQQALIALANEYKHCTLSQKDAAIMIEWAEEYGISNHSPTTHKGRSGYWSTVLHIKIFNIHIQVQE